MSPASPPTVAQALHAATSAYARGDAAGAERWCREALAIDSRCFDALNMLGVVVAGSGRMDEACDLLARAVAANSRNADTWSNLAAVQSALGRHEEAARSCERAIGLRSGFAEAHFNRGVALAALGRHAQALASYDRAAGLRPGDARFHNNRGNVLRALDRDEEALRAFDAALALQPGYADALVNRSTALRALGRHDEAVASCDRALALDGAYAGAHNNRGIALAGLRRYEEAIEAYDRAVALAPGYGEAHYNRGNAQRDVGRLEDALASYGHALAGRPDDVAALHGVAAVASELRRHDVALEAYERLMAIAPDEPCLRGDRLRARMHVCQWDGLDAELEALARATDRAERSLVPGNAIALYDDPGFHLRVARLEAERWAYPLAMHAWPQPAAGAKIRVGYFSADFHDHATMVLMAELFERHDHARFEWTAFSYGPDRDDDMRRRAVAAFDAFVDVRDRSDDEVAQLARERGIDIAIDLKGYTRDARPGIFARRAAPVQAQYLGYPGTMGASFIDYVIADHEIAGPGDECHYDECIVRLPGSYQPNDRLRAPASRASSRADAGLPAEGIVFCCFNASYKITPGTFASWMRILASVEGSVLWVLEDTALAARNLRREAERSAVDPSRLVLAPRLPLAEHLARLRHADVFLDTLPYNAHTTASDALWVGVPVVTLRGRAFAGRVGASLVRAAGAPELVADSASEYERTAIDLANDRARLASLRARLARNRDTSALFDPARIAAHLEAAYRLMHERRRAGLAPAALDLQAGVPAP